MIYAAIVVQRKPAVGNGNTQPETINKRINMNSEDNAAAVPRRGRGRLRKTKEQDAPRSPEELEKVLEAVRVLVEHKIGAHEFASLAGVAYPLPKPEPVLLRAREAAAKWGISYWTLRRWVIENRLSPITGGKGWLFKPEDIEGALKRL